MAENPARPRARGRRFAALTTAAFLAAGLGACSEQEYGPEMVAEPEVEDAATEVEGYGPAGAPDRQEQREPLEVTEDEVIDAVPDDPGESPTTPPPPEDADRAPLEHPTRATEVDPVGEPIEEALPDEPPGGSWDVDEAPEIDPVGEPILEQDQENAGPENAAANDNDRG